ncbi:MAG TPA: hypothetical protein VFF88_02945, partial [Methylocella sp.]|nr:hypothetical protein [Methylocella sp.]
MFETAHLESGVNAPEISHGHGRSRIEPLVFRRIARHGGKGEPLAARRARELLNAIAPIIEPAQEADQNEARLAHG